MVPMRQVNDDPLPMIGGGIIFYLVKGHLSYSLNSHCGLVSSIFKRVIW